MNLVKVLTPSILSRSMAHGANCALFPYLAVYADKYGHVVIKEVF